MKLEWFKKAWVRFNTEGVRKRTEKLLRWLLFGVAIGLLPFAYPAIKSLVVGPSLTAVRLFGRGDLFLITATLVAASFGDLIANGKEQAIRKIWVGFLCLIIFIVCIVWFGVVANAIDAQTAYDEELTSRYSLWLFGFAVVTCSSTLILAEET